MEFEKLLEERYTVRKFDSKKVEEDLIKKILEAGRMAPSAMNKQPYKLYVCTSNEALNKIDAVSPCRYGAPLCIMVAASKDIAWSKEGYSSYDTDASICATYMMLETANLGLGSVWVGMFDTNKAIEEFNIEGYTPLIMLMIGYKPNGTGPLPSHSNRKELSDLAIYV